MKKQTKAEKLDYGKNELRISRGLDRLQNINASGGIVDIIKEIEAEE